LADAELIRRKRPVVDVHIYQAGHGFGCTARESYTPEAAELAWERTLSFFEKHLA
jgi:carboxymethylenebutenolidase